MDSRKNDQIYSLLILFFCQYFHKAGAKKNDECFSNSKFRFIKRLIVFLQLIIQKIKKIVFDR